jgi:hypothetical protein
VPVEVKDRLCGLWAFAGDDVVALDIVREVAERVSNVLYSLAAQFVYIGGVLSWYDK